MTSKTYTLRDLLRWILYNGGVCDPNDCDDECDGRCDAVRKVCPEAFWTAAELDQIKHESEKFQDELGLRDTQEGKAANE